MGTVLAKAKEKIASRIRAILPQVEPLFKGGFRL